MSASNSQNPASVPYLVFLYQEELRGRNRGIQEPEYKYEIKYFLTDELVYTNYTHSRRFTPLEVGHMQDSVIYKKRLRLTIARIKKEQEARNRARYSGR